MLLSMTGQGSAHLSENGVTVSAEARTVNNRYYKLALRTSDGYGAIEPRVDEVVRRVIRRGTVQMDVRVDRESSPDDYQINDLALQSYREQLSAAAGRLGLSAEVSIDALLALPGVVAEQTTRNVDTDADWPIIEQVLVQALEALSKMRASEGAAMAVDLTENCGAIAAELDKVQALAPRVAENYRTRLTERLNKLLAEYEVRVEAADVVREVGLFGERSDISEEVVRLRAHLDQFDRIMQASESSGRKLDFITQEMFREANTIGSKANDAEISAHVVEIKAAIERMREMIQNVE